MINLKELLLEASPAVALREIDRIGDLDKFEPSLSELQMAIPKGYHHKDNWEHSIRVLDKAMALEGDKPDLLLRTAALLHDIGKPATREFHGKGVVSFRNHETVGARLARKVLKAHDYSKGEIAEVDRLIALHMRAYGFGEVKWTDSAVRRLATDAGSDRSLDRLIKIFYSDLTTTNMNKKARVERGIARLEDALARVRELDERKALRPALDGFEVMEMTGLKQGPELGKIMRFLNSDEGVRLTREQALGVLTERFPDNFA